MKVLKSGVPGGAWRTEVICTGAGNGNHGCNAVLEIEAADLFHTQSSDYTGDTSDYITIECLECKAWTDIQKTVDNIPSGVRRAVYDQEPRRPSDNN